jgi:hypothetical protein
LILLAFFLPPALYLLVLGAINKRRSPLLVSGVWDFIGILFAASGFLLFGGPAILTSLNERWRWFWLLGQRTSGTDPEGAWQFWVFLSVLYFLLVVAGCIYVFWRQRHLTAIYNVEPAMVEQALAEVCEHYGLNPVRSGNLFLFGMGLGTDLSRRPGVKESIQPPHYLPAPAGKAASPVLTNEFAGHTAILEMDSFAALRHVTLRWDPPESPLRREIEQDLALRLAQTIVPDHEVGAWLTLLALGLISLMLLGGFLLIVLRWLML